MTQGEEKKKRRKKYRWKKAKFPNSKQLKVEFLFASCSMRVPSLLWKPLASAYTGWKPPLKYRKWFVTEMYWSEITILILLPQAPFCPKISPAKLWEGWGWVHILVGKLIFCSGKAARPVLFRQRPGLFDMSWCHRSRPIISPTLEVRLLQT